MDTLDTKKAQLKPERRPVWPLPEPDGPYVASFSLKLTWRLCLWLTRDILVFLDREAKLWWLSTSENVMSEYASAGPSSLTSFLVSCPQFLLIIQWKLSCMERLPAVSHKPLIVLGSWIVAFYHPAMVKGTFATGVGHGIFSGNANGFQGPSFFYTRHLWFHLCV